MAELRVKYISTLQEGIIDFGGWSDCELAAFARAPFEYASYLVWNSGAVPVENLDDDALTALYDQKGAELAWLSGIRPRYCGRPKLQALVSNLLAAIRDVLAKGFPDIEPRRSAAVRS